MKPTRRLKMKSAITILAFAITISGLIGCGGAITAQEGSTTPTQDSATTESTKPKTEEQITAAEEKESRMKTATFGGGCFWCVESIFLRLEGVETVKSGYMGGFVENPTYKQVCGGRTGHAEVIEIRFDPEVIPFEDLLAVFWRTHDPTTLNRQGNDVGTQYRSVVFYHDDEQRQKAEICKEQLDASGEYRDPIVTEISQASKMYVAEDFHQDYFNSNPDDRYCNAVIPEKIYKLKKLFGDRLKEEYKNK